MGRRLTKEDVEAEIAALDELDTRSLQNRYRELFKVPPPRGIRAAFLRRAIAYRLQEKVHGGLKGTTKRRLKKIAAQEQDTPRGQIKLTPGTQLIREWDGKTEVVDVVRNGYIWRGTTYRSISGVASAIAGTRQAGPRFFGLDVAYKPAPPPITRSGPASEASDQRNKPDLVASSAEEPESEAAE